MARKKQNYIKGTLMHRRTADCLAVPPVKRQGFGGIAAALSV